MAEPLLVAVFARSDQMGGAERGTIELAAAEIGIGRPWLILVRDKGVGQVDAFCSEMEVPFVRVKGPVAAMRVLRRVNPIGVWIFGLRWSSSLRWLLHVGVVRNLRGNRSKVVVAQRGLEDGRRRWQLEIDRRTQRLVDMYVANSEAAAEMLRSRVGISASRVAVIHSGLGACWFESVAEQTHTRNPVRIILVGNDRAEKAYGDALEILRRTLNQPWVATIYTDQSSDLRAKVRELGLEQRVVVICGHQLTPADYDRADILLHAATSESYPWAVLEAKARGLAVVATDVGDVRRLVESEDLFNPGDLDQGCSILRRHLMNGAGGSVTTPHRSGLYSQTTVGNQLRHLISALG